jgi:beta-N-acetylhexosaminidase
MASDLPLESVCGQLVVGGFDGPTLPEDVAEALRAGTRGGAILFKRNLPSLEAAHALCRAINDAAPPELPPFISVDQEGGRVARLGDPVLKLPAMRELGKIGDPALVRRAASALGRELGAIGFNLAFSPVLDVDTNPKNPIIGDRSFGSDPDLVGRLGRAFIEGLQEAGVMACAKHFPGHGDTSRDSHLELPVVEHDKARLDTVELPPFRIASLRGVSALMTAHVVYSELDPGIPATLSRRICTQLLRSEIGFRGVLFSDDLEMRALSDDVEQNAVAAVRAGCDALLVCSSREAQERVYRALLERAQADETFRRRCVEAANRGLAARRRHPPRAASGSELRSLVGAEPARAVLAEILATRR